MTAPHIVYPVGLLGEALSEASPDLMRSLLQTMINALLSADADAVVGAEYGRPTPPRRSCAVKIPAESPRTLHGREAALARFSKPNHDAGRYLPWSARRVPGVHSLGSRQGGCRRAPSRLRGRVAGRCGSQTNMLIRAWCAEARRGFECASKCPSAREGAVALTRTSIGGSNNTPRSQA